jgi:predicted dehydrogenase
MKPKSASLSRRDFLRRMAVTGMAFPFVSRLGAASANELLQHVSFGSSGMAGADLSAITGTKLARLVAVADVDLNRANDLKKKFPDIKIYQDWRQLLDKEARHFDSANVSTPDHMHAPIGLAAMQLGKHVYVQKPLTQNVFECRQMRLQARKYGVVTQMGIQVHASKEYRMAVHLVQNGAIGKVKEIHTWSNKKWGDMNLLPDRSDPVPDGLDWNLWLGVAAKRPFLKGYYHPGNWRKRLDFGTGTFGDMGCHIWDPVFEAAGLTSPLSVRSEGPSPNRDNWAINALIHYVFPGTPYTEGKTVKVTWYDGDARPPQSVADLVPGQGLPGQGSVVIGTKGVMLLPHVDRPHLFPVDQFADFKYPELEPRNHWRQFVDACRGQGKTSALFDYAGPLTETVLLGGVATRFKNQTLEWNAGQLKVTNVKEANRFIRRSYRSGWEPKWV